MKTWQTIRRPALSRHIHKRSYGALVLSGGYEEAGDLGRLRVQAGDVILHEMFEGHQDRFSSSGAVILNVCLPAEGKFQPGLRTIADPDLVVRTAAKSMKEAAVLLLSLSEAKTQACFDWPDELAATLLRNPSLRLAEWSDMRGMTPWSVSRGFSQVFGISPSRFRARVRARRAWKTIWATKEPLAKIAAELGFSDQAHMSRALKNLTGHSPQFWRSAN